MLHSIKIQALLFFIMLGMGAFAQNNSLNFDGTDDYIDCGINQTSLGTNFTLEAWIYPEGSGNYRGIGGAHNGAIQGIIFGQYQTNEWCFATGNGVSWDATFTNAISLNTWTHVAAVYSSGNYIKVYINGILVTENTSIGVFSPMNNFWIGKSYDDINRYFDGKIDEFRIWNDIRTEDEIRQNMHNEIDDPSSETNLISYYKFNESSGTSLSDSKGSNTGTLTNMVGTEWQVSTAHFGPRNCLDFDGVDDNVWISSFSPVVTGTGTFTFWIKLDGNADDNARIISKSPDYNAGDEVYIKSGTTIISTNGTSFVSGTQLEANTSLVIGEWTHVAITANATESKLYLNGVLDATGGPADFSYNSFRIGGQYTAGFWETTDGKFDEFSVWSKVLTEDEIRNVMFSGLTGKETDLAAYYKFDNVNGTILQDFSGNGNDGAMGGMDNSDWITSNAFNMWLNTTSTDWSDGNNWSLGAKPALEAVSIISYNGGSAPDFSTSDEAGGSDIYIDLSSEWTIGGAFSVMGNLFVESNIDLNGNTISLSSDAMLYEGDGRIFGSSGSITTQRSLNNINENVAGLGVTITTAANMGNTTITRTHSNSTEPVSILRKFEISPSNNTGLNATLVYHYYDTELNNQTEANLVLFKSTDGTDWERQSSSVVNTTDNTITLTGLDGFSHWTASEGVYLTGNALQYSGSSQYTSISNLQLSGNTFTVELWVNAETFNGPSDFNISNMIVGGDENFVFRLGDDGVLNNKPQFVVLIGGHQKLNANSTLDANKWYHLAGVYDGSEMRLYIDGQLDNSRSQSGAIQNTSVMTILGGTNNDSRMFDGQLDEVRVWNTARSEQEIRENMCKTLTGNESGLLAYYNCNASSGTSLKDISGNGNDGTLVNSPTWTDSDAFTTWTGHNCNDWSTASNWTDGTPTSVNNVGIYSCSNNNVISGTPTVENFVLGSAGSATLSSDITVNGSLILESNFDFNGQTINLGSSAMLIEDGGILEGATGKITTTRNLNNIDENVGGIGAEITTSSDLGSTLIERYNQSIPGFTGDNSINRYYIIDPTNNSNLDATLVFHYDDSELNGLSEGDLVLYKSDDNGITWVKAGGIVNIADNTISLSGIDDFSWWTAAEDGAFLPIELLNFEAYLKDGVVQIDWSTASEENNDYFEIERSLDLKEWSSIAKVDGQGNSTHTTHYSISDDVNADGVYYYRLRQVDFNGTVSYSGIEKVMIGLLKDLIVSVYPNPSADNLFIQVEGDYDIATVQIYNALGLLVEAEYESVSNNIYRCDFTDDPGCYYLKIIFKNGQEINKKVLKQ